ncbi:MAG: 16S rRNA (guanine(966)-N(2))-methyltransferase RsmD [Clostridiales bacterium]|nr:16S rRNA (guanine(966)-N(2))-methyltransferase RsmD [Clostridiales bacterium]
MRIIAGTLGGRRYDIPGGLAARPTAERVRESLFSILRGRIEGALVLDLFAGSGALGIEALSRGADCAVFCDIDRRAATAIGAVLRRFGVPEDRYEILASDFRQALGRFGREGRRFDVAFIDPPYGADFEAAALASLCGELMARSGVVVLERSRRQPPPAIPAGWTADERRYADTALFILKREEAP